MALNLGTLEVGKLKKKYQLVIIDIVNFQQPRKKNTLNHVEIRDPIAFNDV